jgi:hypothetical protein
VKLALSIIMPCHALAFPAFLCWDVGPSRQRGVCISAPHLSLYIKHTSRVFPSFCHSIRAAAMNFVDVQPKSFLDYAWTSPSSAAMAATKPSKTSRKQNRCCDQCRKGKRACDAAILEDTLLETSKSGTTPTVFHYSGEPRPYLW